MIGNAVTAANNKYSFLTAFVYWQALTKNIIERTIPTTTVGKTRIGVKSQAASVGRGAKKK